MLLPRACAGCSLPGETLCARCREIFRNPPMRVITTIPQCVPVWSLGVYAKERRRAIIHMKERGRRDVIPYCGAVLRAALESLCAQGELPSVYREAVLVPAPTRRRARRVRGGDPVEGICQAAGFPVLRCVYTAARGKESVGLGVRARRDNAVASIRLDQRGARVLCKNPREVIVIDDIVTTGATLAATVRVLQAVGARVAGALVLAHA